jgi:ubiquinone/menaquinone biosynthesis C-methylase UbiE
MEERQVYNILVEQHYARPGIFDLLVQQLKQRGIEEVSVKDLAAVDEFHVCGAAVSAELAKEINFPPHAKVLDVGCGLGGPARLLASRFGARVTGIDITEEYVETAKKLSDLVQLSHLTQFARADALQLPFEEDHFDIVWTQHVQMNIADKKAFYEEIRRVLTPGGSFAYYDIFSTGDKPPAYPLPWANEPTYSFLFSKEACHAELEMLGFKRTYSKDQTAEGITFFTDLFARIEKEGWPALSLRLLTGDLAAVKFQNLFQALKTGKLELESACYTLG